MDELRKHEQLKVIIGNLRSEFNRLVDQHNQLLDRYDDLLNDEFEPVRGAMVRFLSGPDENGRIGKEWGWILYSQIDMQRLEGNPLIGWLTEEQIQQCKEWWDWKNNVGNRNTP